MPWLAAPHTPASPACLPPARLPTREASVLKNLEHHVEHIGVRLLNLIKQHHGVWPPPVGGGEGEEGTAASNGEKERQHQCQASRRVAGC